ncbi:hypothetical protein GEV33_006443 [Tenebrio molitor]|uniref:Uncharacterized protein n=1 Tax=Tenebrio molitor TaxID=7067 RepID=A0A8J6HMM1_TENMO|nr:hypothetical protein GEV33_006443 [Tenebrio molitor]
MAFEGDFLVLDLVSINYLLSGDTGRQENRGKQWGSCSEVDRCITHACGELPPHWTTSKTRMGLHRRAKS